MIELNEELHEAVTAQPEEPLILVDRATKQTYVLLRADEYERMKRIEFDDTPWTSAEMAAFVSEVMAQDDAENPFLEGYQALGKERP